MRLRGRTVVLALVATVVTLGVPEPVQSQQRPDIGELFPDQGARPLSVGTLASAALSPASAWSCERAGVCDARVWQNLQEWDDGSDSVLGAAIFGAITTALVGGAIGAVLAGGSDAEGYAALRGFGLGAAIGSTIGAAGAADLDDGSTRTFSRRFPLAALVGAGVIGASVALDTGVLVIGLPILQGIVMNRQRFD